MNNEIIIRDPIVSFSSLGNKVTITFDNTNGDYDDILPQAFIGSNIIGSIDFKNGIKVVRRYENDDECGVQRILFDFIIHRSSAPTAINYV